MKTERACGGLVWLCLGWLLVWGLPVWAESPSQEDKMVWSEYQSPVPGRGNSIICWRFAERTLASGEMLVAVRDVRGSRAIRADLWYDSDRRLVRVDCYRQVRGREEKVATTYAAAQPVLLNQTLIPGDWLNRPLPFVAQEGRREYQLQEQVKDTVFASHLRIEEERISSAAATAAGMLGRQNQVAAAGPDLYLVTVTRLMGTSTEVPVLRQLWASGDSFWLYEEKAGRCSWRGSAMGE
ncbi:MAG TPA: hypothetical protein ENN66_02150 [Proteobacteria bacterium]|nr:hypothetical protein [Pseudomonadota bacterium]